MFLEENSSEEFLEVIDKTRILSCKKDKFLVVALGEVLKEERRTSNLCK